MSVFPVCPRCLAEYQEPRNRRFHAQPNACWQRGPQSEIRDTRGNRLPVEDPIAEAIARLLAGEIIAIKGLGGFHLAVDPTIVSRFCVLSAEERELLRSPQRPIVLLPRTNPCPLADSIALFNSNLGIFLPYTPIHHLLLKESELQALVMTSSNLSEEPIAIANCEAVARLGDVADFFLLRCDDAVLRRTSGRTRQLRRSRGFVLVPVFLKKESPTILAVQGELKYTICLQRAGSLPQPAHRQSRKPRGLQIFLGRRQRSAKNPPDPVLPVVALYIRHCLDKSIQCLVY